MKNWNINWDGGRTISLDIEAETYEEAKEYALSYITIQEYED